MGEFAVHGGDFFGAIGIRLDELEKRHDVVNADVLDAWYGPSPRALAAVREHLDWLIRTSPPTHAEGLRQVVAECRGVSEAEVLLGPGSSHLIFLLIPRLFGGKRVVLLDPTYGEYAHLLGQHGATIERFELNGPEFRPSVPDLIEFCQQHEGLILVNPNSPTGVALTLAEVETLVSSLPTNYPIWIDETYIDYCGEGQSAEPLAQKHPNLVVCKSMSKFYALSGLRVGYVVAAPDLVRTVEPEIAPWSVGLLAQLAAAEALRDTEYYVARRAETATLRGELEATLTEAGFEITPSAANFIMFRVESAKALVAEAEKRNIFLRNCDSLSPRFHDDYVRAAVKDEPFLGRLKQFLSSR